MSLLWLSGATGGTMRNKTAGAVSGSSKGCQFPVSHSILIHFIAWLISISECCVLGKCLPYIDFIHLFIRFL